MQILYKLGHDPEKVSGIPESLQCIEVMYWNTVIDGMAVNKQKRQEGKKKKRRHLHVVPQHITVAPGVAK